MFIAVLAVVGLRLFPAVAAQGWLPVGSLVFGMLLIVGALVEAVRRR